jgi:hypothetical protein
LKPRARRATLTGTVRVRGTAGARADEAGARLAALLAPSVEAAEQEARDWRLGDQPLDDRDSLYVAELLNSIDPNDRRELRDSIHGGPASHPRVKRFIDALSDRSPELFERLVEHADVDLDGMSADFEFQAAENLRANPYSDDSDPDVDEHAFWLAVGWYGHRAAAMVDDIRRLQRSQWARPNRWPRCTAPSARRRSPGARPHRRRRRVAARTTRTSRGEPAPDSDLDNARPRG